MYTRTKYTEILSPTMISRRCASPPTGTVTSSSPLWLINILAKVSWRPAAATATVNCLPISEQFCACALYIKMRLHVGRQHFCGGMHPSLATNIGDADGKVRLPFYTQPKHTQLAISYGTFQFRCPFSQFMHVLLYIYLYGIEELVSFILSIWVIYHMSRREWQRLKSTSIYTHTQHTNSLKTPALYYINGCVQTGVLFSLVAFIYKPRWLPAIWDRPMPCRFRRVARWCK